MNSALGPERPATISSGMPGRFVLSDHGTANALDREP